MKITLKILLSFFIVINAFGAELNLDYLGMIKEKKSCRKRAMGCSISEELEIAQFEGKVLDSYQLNSYISQNGEAKSYFIPLSLNDKELVILAASTSLGIVAFKNDQEIMDVVQRNKSKTTETLTNIGNFYGSSAFGFVAAGSYFLGVYYDNNNLKQVGLFTVSATAAQFIIGQGIKAIFGRERPTVGDGPYEFFQAGQKSFYSGHTSTAFALATVISETYKSDYPIVPWVAYGLAAVTAYGRVHGENHWASDVIIGGIAGHLITKLTMNFINKNTDGRGGFEVIPGYDHKSGTVSVLFNWKEKQPEAPLKCHKMPDGMLKVDACIAEALAKK